MQQKPLLLIYFLILLDQTAKMLVQKLNLFYSINSGISFGLLTNFSSLLLIIFISLILLSLVYVSLNRQKKTTGELLAFILILAGGTGNLFDRLRFGGAVDFVVIGKLPVFNLADVMISVGFVLFLFQLREKKDKNKLPR